MNDQPVLSSQSVGKIEKAGARQAGSGDKIGEGPLLRGAWNPQVFPTMHPCKKSVFSKLKQFHKNL